MPLQLRRSKQFFRSGFTLIEILVVITIIGLVMAFAASRIFGQGDEAKKTLQHVLDTTWEPHYGDVKQQAAGLIPR